MSAAPASLVSWLVSAHPRGEVLTIEERGPSLALWLLGQPEGFSVPEVQGWLHDVAGVAHESASHDTTPQPIPVLLRHALSGLLFSHSEMWPHAEGMGPCSVAFTSGEDGIGIGWIGDAEVSVLLDNQTCDVRWVLVRDDHGREARAWSIEAGRDVRVTLRWQLRPGDADSPRVLLEARTRPARMTTEPSAVVAAARFVPPARRVPAAQPPPPVAVTPEVSGFEPIADQPMLEPVPIESAAGTGPSVEALYETDPPEDMRAEYPAPTHPIEMSPAATIEDAIEIVPQFESIAPIEEAPDVRLTPPVLVVPDLSMPEPASELADATPSALPAEPATRPVAEIDPARPSSGIARWLSKNFAWMRPRGRAVEPEPEPELPPLPTPIAEPLVEQQEMMEIVTPADPPALAALPESAAAEADGFGEIESGPPSEREHEDQLARTAAALAELLGGMDATPDAETHPPAPVEVIADPSRIFDLLPEQIPPTPEASELTACTTSAEIDPREITLPDLAVAPIDPPMPPPTPQPTPPAVTAPPRLPSFVRAPVARPDAEARPEFDPHARLAIEPAFSLPAAASDPPDRSFVPLEDSRITEPEPVPERAATPELPTPIAAARAPGMDVEAEPPLPTPPVPAVDTAIAMEPDGVLAVPPSARRRTALHPNWPSENEVETEATGRTRTTWIVLGAVIAVLFGVGWLVGSLQGGRHSAPATAKGPLALFGIKGPTFKTEVKSQPDGAWIVVDGTPTRQRTPFTLELPPGRHEITLTFGQWGQAVYPVQGKRNQTQRVDGTLWGSLEVGTPELGVLIAVAVDGRARGFAPVVVDSLAPGPHQVRFSGPGMPSWGQTVEIHVAQRQQVLARTVRSPATGVLQVRANRTEAGESEPFSGARVWIDGDMRGVTPLTLELPRGPHSVRVELGDERLPVQMIDLPGGNQRFATFELGTGEDHPVVRLDAPARIDADRPAVISATLTEVSSREVREMWLHVLGPDGTWSRYPMARLQGQLSPVGAVAFPITQIGANGRTSWYASAVTTQGDEFFSEIQTIRR